MTDENRLTETNEAPVEHPLEDRSDAELVDHFNVSIARLNAQRERLISRNVLAKFVVTEEGYLKSNIQ